MKILIVDDSLQAMQNIQKIMEELGHEVIGLAKDGIEAVEAYKKERPDCVTMDVTMPNLGGIDALKEIIEYDDTAKVVMMTSSEEEDLMFEAFEEGALYYLTKPLAIDRVKYAIHAIHISE